MPHQIKRWGYFWTILDISKFYYCVKMTFFDGLLPNWLSFINLPNSSLNILVSKFLCFSFITMYHVSYVCLWNINIFSKVYNLDTINKHWMSHCARYVIKFESLTNCLFFYTSHYLLQICSIYILYNIYLFAYIQWMSLRFAHGIFHNMVPINRLLCFNGST